MQTRARKKAYHAGSHPETKDQASPRAVLTRRSRGKAADSAKTTSRRAEATRNTRNPETIPPEAYLLTKLPVELKTEICSHLHPRDLCSLIRTCKTFKELLLDRRSQKSVWNQALQARDLPTRPSFVRMSDPAWVHLLFSPHCHHCGAPDVDEVVWEWLKRYCQNCLVLPTIVDDARELVESIDPRISLGDICNYHGLWRYDTAILYSKAQVDACVAECRALLQDPNASRNRNDALRSFIRSRQTITIGMRNYSDDCRQWAGREEKSHRYRRLEELLDRLRQNGWGQEVDFLGEQGCRNRIADHYPFNGMLAGRSPLPWRQLMPRAYELFRQVRKERVWTERLQALEEAILAHYVQLPRTPQMDIRPPYIEFALMKECRVLAQATLTRTITSDDFTAIIPGLADRWFAEKADMLRSRLQTHLRSSPDVKDPLELAVAVWVCRHCNARLRFPAVLAHPCAYQWPDQDAFAPSVSELLGSAHYVHTATLLTCDRDKDGKTSIPFNAVNFFHDEQEVADVLSEIVQTLGLDPTCTLATDLDRCQARLYCRRCNDPRRAFGWEAALFHSISEVNHWGTTYRHREWTRVSDNELPLVQRVEAAKHVLSFDAHPSALWACSLCINFNARGYVMKKHLESLHGKEDPDACIREGIAYVYSPSGKALLRPPVNLPVY
ncbi:hypothetical protein C8Q76DRAFT_792993 [Earliella scabrosa]|nr:hypothetical protein C8Q76DRAFT_792993 [Earliella scabrosa]